MTVLPQGETNGKVVVFYHGIQEHAARYQHAMERFATLGYKVIAMDMRGHGLSEGKRAYFKRFEVLLADATQFLDEIVLSTMDASKVFFWGQSFGGLMAPYVVLENKEKLGDKLGGLLMTSSAVGVDYTLIQKIQLPLGPPMSAIFPKAALTPVVDPKDMSSDSLAVANYKDDPLNTGGNLMARVAVEADKRGVNLQKATTAAGIACPLYMAHGTKDACTSLKKAKIFFEGTSSSDKVFEEKDLRHTMLHEPERDNVIKSICDWLEAH